jgi:multiple sugar transport system substrate-binding protein
MTDFKGLTRRKLLQFAAAGAAAGGLLSQRRAVLAQTQEAIILPSESGRFENIELTYFQDSGWLHAPLWLSPIFMKDAGVGIKSRQQYEAGDAMNQVLPELLAEQPHFDWVQYPSPFFGTFAETGQLEPLDEYLMRYPSGKDYLDWVMPAYAEFYTRWNGKTYGVMLDGDIHVLHYRKSRFADPALQKKYSARFQRDLLVPKTWQEFIDCTQFFTEELSSQGIYGASTVIAPPAVGWSVWMNIAAGNGVNYFDAAMNPAINTPPAVQALEVLKQIAKFGPPGKETMGVSQASQRWQGGMDVMAIWWMDLAKSTAQLQGPDLAEDQGVDIVPGWRQADGTVRHRAISGWCRTASIPKNAPQSIKDAAFYFIYRMSHPQVSDRIVADPYCGSKPFGASHYTDAAAQLYLKPNPQRDANNELWPMNAGIFRNFATARDYLDGGLKNVQVGYPQLYWEGMPEYADALGRNIAKAVSGELTSQQALDEAAEAWVKIVQKRGIEKQKAQYANFLAGARKLGYQL